MNSSLLRKLNNLCTLIDNNNNVNNGGCCWLAYIIASNLEKYNIPYKVAIYADEYTNDEDIYRWKTSIKNRNKTGVFSANKWSCAHIWLVVDGKKINSCDYKSLCTISLSSKDLRWLYTKGIEHNNWNKDYNTRYNSLVKRYINLLFKYECKED